MTGLKRRFLVASGSMGTSAWRRGFTMVELMVVLAIVSIALTVAVPTFSRTENNRSLRAETLTVQRMMQFARSEAVAKRQFVAVEFDLQLFPLTDRIRVLGDAQWNAGLSRWEGTAVAGGFDHTVNILNDVQELRVGVVKHLTGVHSIVFSPTGACALDDGSTAGPIEMDIVSMGT